MGEPLKKYVVTDDVMVKLAELAIEHGWRMRDEVEIQNVAGAVELPLPDYQRKAAAIAVKNALEQAIKQGKLRAAQPPRPPLLYGPDGVTPVAEG